MKKLKIVFLLLVFITGSCTSLKGPIKKRQVYREKQFSRHSGTHVCAWEKKMVYQHKRRIFNGM
jgi:hypothetical protein